MPTKKQLSHIWESQFEYFGGSGQPRQTYGVNLDENGLTTQQLTDVPIMSKNNYSEFKGDIIGMITFNEQNKNLKVTVSYS